jgi:hypothetical protein
MHLHPVESMIRCIQATEDLDARRTSIFELESDYNKKELERLQEESFQKIREEEAAVESRDQWSIYSNAGQYLAGGTAIAVGTVVAGPAGAAMAASGGIGLAGRVSYDTGFTKWLASWFYESEETQKSIASQIDKGTTFLSSAVGMASGLWSMHVNALSASMLANQLKTALGITTNVVSTTTRVGTSFYDRRIAYLRGPLKENEAHQQQIKQNDAQEIQDMSAMLESSQELTDIARKAINALEVQGD